jgi:hypothetical protein
MRSEPEDVSTQEKLIYKPSKLQRGKMGYKYHIKRVFLERYRNAMDLCHRTRILVIGLLLKKSRE